MKKIMIIVLLVFIVFLATGFEGIIRGRTEIENLYSITLCGFDKNDDEIEEFRITTVSPTTEEDAEKLINVMTSVGETIFQVNRKIGLYAEKDIFWGHNKYILIGEDAAKEDVFKYLDFSMRDQELRLTAMPIVIKGLSAQEFILYLYEQNVDIPSNIDNMIENLVLMSYSSVHDLVDFINMSYENKDGYLPYLELQLETQELIIEQGSEEIIEGKFENFNEKIVESPTKEQLALGDVIAHISGYAIFKDGKVIEYIKEDTARGLNWIINEIVSGVIIVEEKEAKFNLEIIEGKSEIIPKIEGDTLSVELKVYVSTNISEINGMDVKIDAEMLNTLEEKQRVQVLNEVQEVIKIAQENEIDILGIGNKVYHKYPVKWEDYKDDWDDIFSELDIKVTVASEIERSYKFTESIFFKEVE